ncbi:MAG: hypothetical protein KC591_06800 [Gemmatimonadetes bacterium]|nr:hypothetical protein [Gemmatimonadota bacterium]
MTAEATTRLTGRVLLWIARLAGTAVVVPLAMMLFGESGTGPANLREWIYLALFPVGFSIAYLLGWRWPRFAGGASLVCMAASLLVVGRTFAPEVYTWWGLLCVPGALFLLGSVLIRRPSRGEPTPAS